MRGNEVRIGGEYLARVSGIVCIVEVVRELFARRGTRWACMNTRTGRMIEVSAARLRPMRRTVRLPVRAVPARTFAAVTHDAIETSREIGAIGECF